MKMQGILFSAPMVRAILNGTKTQTRRTDERWRSRYDRWQAGDHDLMLWVRETFWHAPRHMGFDTSHGLHGTVAYSADGLSADSEETARAYGLRQKPSIHMPRWASRIDLRVTNMRCERLQDISEDDARAEGAMFVDEVSGRVSLDDRRGCYRDGFRALWYSINGPGSWDANPEVIVIEFTRAKP